MRSKLLAVLPSTLSLAVPFIKRNANSPSYLHACRHRVCRCSLDQSHLLAPRIRRRSETWRNRRRAEGVQRCEDGRSKWFLPESRRLLMTNAKISSRVQIENMVKGVEEGITQL